MKKLLALLPFLLFSSLAVAQNYSVVTAEVYEGTSLHIPSEGKRVTFSNLKVVLLLDTLSDESLEMVSKGFLDTSPIGGTIGLMEIDTAAAVVTVHMKAFNVGSSKNQALRKNWESVFEGQNLKDLKKLISPDFAIQQAARFREGFTYMQRTH